VDWGLRRELLDRVTGGAAPDAQTRKLWLIWTLLGLRARRPEAFDAGAYQPVVAGESVAAFIRGGSVLVAVSTRPGGEVDGVEAGGDWSKLLGDDEHGFAVWERVDR
jgi:maltooligosyltrehalose synthase